ncbi:pyridine nucleotide-disulfide oxidoreductase [Helicobacter sp. 13S00401-1]|uniref:NAD(P)-binding domain-containing protein n=1 Tax=Helicobacter sp. 13S00401-1 TaxID=1905758 RepID=UPI000BA58337|nr:NAD(P)-binding domain-containing protein [Helicobacter sp. 13S00401-1]PAF50406.1 pyridine nucleotide-disulfide oxidoreductase [Helicobacter sp. 13S00401-1]
MSTENIIHEVGIIGAGPGGIAAAVECKKYDIKDVIVFEKTDSILSTIHKFYKAHKHVDKDYKNQVVTLRGHIPFGDGFKESTLELFENQVASNHIDVRFNTEIDKVEKDGDLFVIRSTSNEIFKAKFVIVSIGKMGQPNKPTYALPPTVRKYINFNANECQVGEKVLVVGGGNSAVEYAVDLASQTETTLNYRKAEFTRINDTNAEALKKVLDSKKLLGKFGVDITSLEAVPSRSGDAERDSIKVNFTDGSSDIYDRIVYAIGGVAPLDFLHKCGIKVDSNGVPLADANHETPTKNLFVVGDILFKNGGSIAIAMNNGLDIVECIRKRLS